MTPDHPPPKNPTERFSDRVADYVKARPDYPPEVINLLQNRARLGPAVVVADLGAGTGIFTRALLQTGATVHAVEPNEAMREALIAASTDEPRLQAVPGTAEATGLSDASVDLITAAQAFHWFDREAARHEFKRILRPDGWVALIWNSRSAKDGDFHLAYENLLHRWSIDYHQVGHRNVDAACLATFLGSERVEEHVFSHWQECDHPMLVGRLSSTSYVPGRKHVHFRPMIEDLDRLFSVHQRDGVVEFCYQTTVYLGQF